MVTVREPPTSKNNWVRAETSFEQIGDTLGGFQTCSGNLLLFVSRDSQAEDIAYGDVLLLNTQLLSLGPPSNPHAFDYQQFLHFKNIHHQAFVRAGHWSKLKEGRGSPWYAQALKWRSKFLLTLRKHLSSPDEFAVGAALILGYRNELPEDSRDKNMKRKVLFLL